MLRFVAPAQGTFTRALEFTSEFTARAYPNLIKHFDPAGIEEALAVTGTDTVRRRPIARRSDGRARGIDDIREVFEATIVGEPDRAHLRTGDLGFVVNGELFVTGRINATSSWRATAAIGRSRMTAIPSTSHTASSIPAGSKCLIRFGHARAVNSDMNSSASVNIPWGGGATSRGMILQTPSG
jgi:hypothetical protein